MSELAWLSVPVGIDAQRWVTRAARRTVLVVVHTVVAGQRLLDIVDMVETDLRVQMVYTRAPSAFGNGVTQLLNSLDVVEIAWHQAVRERFDLAIAAGYTGLDELHAPIMVLPHGAGHAKRARGYRGVTGYHRGGARVDRPIYGLDAQRLVRDDRVVPASIVLSHKAQREVLARQCPPAAELAVVAGDPCYDRMLASVGRRSEYRAALGVTPERRLVVVASTWGPQSLFARNLALLSSVLQQLDPARYQVAALIHPAVWFGHGPRQVRAWLAESRAAGLMLIEPLVDWRVAVLAADYVIGDHGSTTVYASAIGVPVLHVGVPTGEIDASSPQAWLGERAPVLARSRPVEVQLHRAAKVAEHVGRQPDAMRLTSRPGQAHRVLRREMYRLLGLSVPGRHRGADPIPVPADAKGAWHV
ncbi:MAG TPA: hypothetical protein VGX25_08695 [Actinophytocola sp.]|uniref:hypothetical protein n=1 Tax=Actinophytocola sp. TaxID=1872138 RepID=UPI002DDCC8FD|nr:hypothetical protein [Actinophytocola sp.]HEV2779466.1 hypothetical protein [Actinophytocola sp.]